MNGRQALSFVRKHGIVLMSARDPRPNLAEAIAGEPIRGSWWGHPLAHPMLRVFESVRDSPHVLVCRLARGKVTFVHQRLWPALVRLARQLPQHGLAAVREEHCARGHHRVTTTPYPRWVPPVVLERAKRLTEQDALAQLGFERIDQLAAWSRSASGVPGPDARRTRAR